VLIARDTLARIASQGGDSGLSRGEHPSARKLYPTSATTHATSMAIFDGGVSVQSRQAMNGHDGPPK